MAGLVPTSQDAARDVSRERDQANEVRKRMKVGVTSTCTARIKRRQSGGGVVKKRRHAAPRPPRQARWVRGEGETRQGRQGGENRGRSKAEGKARLRPPGEW